MSYVIEQRIKGKIYLYEVESYWDKEKKQPRQRRKYLGRKKDDFRPGILNNLNSISVKIFGDTFLLKSLSERLKLPELLVKVFPENYNEILALAFYEIAQSSPLYLFHYWLEEHHLNGVKKLDSTAISELCEIIGKSKDCQLSFLSSWIEHLSPINAIYYDITSISSYGTNNEYIEWGHNRDAENLPQINMGVMCCSRQSLPILYRLYTGSIVDVTTLKNSLSYLNAFGLKDFMCIMDRGFYSSSNILELNSPENCIKFIQPLPFSVKKVKQLVQDKKRELGLSYNAFSINNEILYYVKDQYILDEKNIFDAHVFFNEKSHIDQKQVILEKIIQLHKKIENLRFENKKQFDEYRDSEIPSALKEYFRFDRFTKKAERNNKAIEKAITRLGTFVIATNHEMSKENVLSYYRKKDMIEKMFDMVKNEMDGQRLRAHNHTTMEGRLFIKFIALILYCEIYKTLKKNDVFKKFTVKEMICELRKLRITTIGEQPPILTELTKRHKQIFEAFNLEYKVA